MCINISACTGRHCPRWPLGKQTWRQGQETSPHILCLLDMCDKFVKEKHCEKHFKTPPSVPPRQTLTCILPPMWQLYRDLLLYVITVIFFPVQVFNFKVATSFGRGVGGTISPELLVSNSQTQTQTKQRCHQRPRIQVADCGYPILDGPSSPRGDARLRFHSKVALLTAHGSSLTIQSAVCFRAPEPGCKIQNRRARRAVSVALTVNEAQTKL